MQKTATSHVGYNAFFKKPLTSMILLILYLDFKYIVVLYNQIYQHQLSVK